MQRPQFAELLADRRRQLRLSVPQAARVLRMRESVLEAFEIGDFDHLPALGYAQGMVASYARYLGLDPRRNHRAVRARACRVRRRRYRAGLPRPRSPLGRARHDGPASAASQARSTTTALPSRARVSRRTAPRPLMRDKAPTTHEVRMGQATRAPMATGSDRRYTTRNPNDYEDRARRPATGWQGPPRSRLLWRRVLARSRWWSRQHSPGPLSC